LRSGPRFFRINAMDDTKGERRERKRRSRRKMLVSGAGLRATWRRVVGQARAAREKRKKPGDGGANNA